MSKAGALTLAVDPARLHAVRQQLQPARLQPLPQCVVEEANRRRLRRLPSQHQAKRKQGSTQRCERRCKAIHVDVSQHDTP